MNFFQRLSFINKVIKGYKVVKNVLDEPKTDEVKNKITGAINKIKDGLQDLRKYVPETKPIVELILKEMK